ncbi:uncharacterized protein LOC107274509 isoform X3 [Cephus cinctus]|uniref:Uncharacterized protein LOC107274509 isoform X3 n=1 Tax=Cephus cinctus TaxID=211228 RepID=A0AAJ7W8A3_CEPCN|nr:uncharacterized protein LOC107274509 isoform X3 [Cephus cinctus]
MRKSNRVKVINNKSMFLLLQFEDGIYYICGKSRITSRHGDTCCAKYTDGGRYPAKILTESDDYEYLTHLKKEKEEKLNTVHSPITIASHNANAINNTLTGIGKNSNVTFTVHQHDPDLESGTNNILAEIDLNNNHAEKTETDTDNTFTNLSYCTLNDVSVSYFERLLGNSIANDSLLTIGNDSNKSFDVNAQVSNTVILNNSTESNFDLENVGGNSNLAANSTPVQERAVTFEEIPIGGTYNSNTVILNNTSESNFDLKNVDGNSNLAATSTPVQERAVTFEEIPIGAATSTPVQERAVTFEEIPIGGAEVSSESASEYQPSESNISIGNTSEEDNDSENKEQRIEEKQNETSSRNSCLDISSKGNTPERYIRDDADMFVDISDGKRGLSKKTFCMYCKKLQSKFARHLENVHNDIEDVKRFSVLPKKNPERKKIIDTIRKNCNFYFNTNNNVNDGELLVCRRPNSKLKKTAGDFRVCQNCKGFFSSNNIRHHAQRCFGYNGKKTRSLMIMGRKIVGRIHPEASKCLRREVFPILREDAIVRLIRYDRLIILYGNKMCCKYRLQHQHEMIRANLRLLGRFLAALKDIDNDITEFTTLYDPKFYDAVIMAINIVAGFDENTNTYRAPSTAYNLGSLIKKIGNLLVTDCIKRHDVTQKTNAEDFLKLLVEDICHTVNKTVTETQTQQKRRKKVELPSFKDIKKLFAYLKEKRNSAYQSLEKEFTLEAWFMLAQTTLTSVQVFNRRRAGEIERMFIEDFQSYERINAKLLKNLSSDSQTAAKKYVRFVIRGKLNRTVPVLLSMELLNCIEMILKYRDEAGVPSKNRFVFGIPAVEKKRNKYLRACYLLRKFAKDSGVDFPAKLTGTTLRKHVATNCINLNLSENEINDVANFMGHADKIHREHYRQPIVSREILRISKVLELAQGSNENEQETDDSADSEDEEDHLNVENNEHLRDREEEIPKQLQNRNPKRVPKSTSIQVRDDSDDEEIFENLLNAAGNISRKRKALGESIKPKKDKRRSTSPFGTVKSKKRWTDEEKNVAMKLFSTNIKTQTYPSLKTIQTLSNQYTCFKERSPTVIKTWISNEIKKKQRRNSIQTDLFKG